MVDLSMKYFLSSQINMIVTISVIRTENEQKGRLSCAKLDMQIVI